jgi:hypothetical protein
MLPAAWIRHEVQHLLGHLDVMMSKNVASVNQPALGSAEMQTN